MGKRGIRFSVPYLPVITDQAVDKFWSRVVLAGPDECWLWVRRRRKPPLDNWQYGALIINGRSYLAHRFSWTLHNREEPGNRVICHACDNPLCVNPQHLWAGTDRANRLDSVAKGRSWQKKRPELLPLIERELIC